MTTGDPNENRSEHPSAEYRAFLTRLRAYERLEPSARSRGPEKLEGVRRIAAELGHPERAYRIVHVAGTNGKGMTAAMIARLIAGDEGGDPNVRCGLYTSPHVVSLRERIAMVDTRGIITPIAPAAFVQAGARVLERVPPADRSGDAQGSGVLHGADYFGYFDLLTLIALEAFRDAGVGWVVLETGLGGRSDATNITPKELCVLTPIGLDHLHVLGNDLRTIAAEKLGIVTSGTPTVLARQPSELTGWMEEQLASLSAHVISAQDYTPLHSEGRTPKGGLLVRGRSPTGLSPKREELEALMLEWPVDAPALNGPRLACAGMALAAAEQVLGRATGKDREARLRTALETTLPGRLEHRVDQPVPGSPGRRWARVVLDGGHNGDALIALCAQLTHWEMDRFALLLSLQKDKLVPPLEAPLRTLLRGAARVMILKPQTVRAPEAEALEAFLRPLLPEGRPTPIEVYPSPEAALHGAGERPEEPLVVAGSLWTVGDVIRLLDGIEE